MRRFFCLLTIAVCAFGSVAHAQDVAITAGQSERQFSQNGTSITIKRIQDENATIPGEFAQVARRCPPYCIQPMQSAPGVITIAELEMMDFMEFSVSSGTGLLIDARLPQEFNRLTIPGAANVPFATLEPNNPYRDDLLTALGVTGSGGSKDFSGAFDLAVFGNGAWSDNAARAVQNLVAAGYPPEKLQYYRGGMQMWLALGLSTSPQ